jgi:hypothetical protein
VREKEEQVREITPPTGISHTSIPLHPHTHTHTHSQGSVLFSFHFWILFLCVVRTLLLFLPYNCLA